MRNAFDAGSIQYNGKWQGVGALETKTLLVPVKWHQADRRVPFGVQVQRWFYVQEPTGGFRAHTPPPVRVSNISALVR